jgi:hypothetical protein
MRTLATSIDPRLDKTIRRLAKLPPPRLAFAAGSLLRELEDAVVLVSEMRGVAVQVMLADGLSLTEVAELLGMSPSQAQLCAEAENTRNPRLRPRH